MEERRVANSKYIVGNWKMNGVAGDLPQIEQIDLAARKLPHTEVAICPPFTLIEKAVRAAGSISIGAQDVHDAASGAHTGCISAAMARECGARFSIIGHSERRAENGETSALVAAKAAALHAAEMRAILCVGETLDMRDAGNAAPFVTGQLAESLPSAVSSDWLTVAYEPIWAIGTGRVPELTDIADMHRAIRDMLVEKMGQDGRNVRILYGGSVNGGNAADILAVPDVDGALVGGASLTAEKFVPIIEAAASS